MHKISFFFLLLFLTQNAVSMTDSIGMSNVAPVFYRSNCSVYPPNSLVFHL